MEAFLNFAENQWTVAAARAIEQAFTEVKGRVLKAAKFTAAYPFELTIMAFVALLAIYALLFAPPLPPCKDIY